MEEVNVTKQVTQKEIKSRLVKELEILEKANEILSEIVEVRGKVSDTCDEIKTFKPEIRKNVISQCSDIQKELSKLYDLVSDTVF